MTTIQGMAKFISRLALLPFFPSKPEERQMLAEAIEEFVESDEQLEWLANRALKLYAEWPGPRELRAAFCSKFRPKDGVNAYSTVYPDGIESERARAPQIAGPELLQLPPGHSETADPEFEKLIHEAAEVMALPPAFHARRGRFANMLEEVITPPEDRPQPAPTPQVITQEDIDRAVAENRRRREQGIAEVWASKEEKAC